MSLILLRSMVAAVAIGNHNKSTLKEWEKGKKKKKKEKNPEGIPEWPMTL